MNICWGRWESEYINSIAMGEIINKEGQMYERTGKIPGRESTETVAFYC